MKIRKGFVSNSSSSSFLVVFPRMPKSVDDVFKFMFKKVEGNISYYSDDSLSHSKICANIFGDIECNEFKKATLEDIVHMFARRYHYYPKSRNTFWDGQKFDKDGGSWMAEDEKYFGLDKDLMNQLKQMYILDEKRSEEANKEEVEILKRAPKLTLHAYKGYINPKTKKMWTAKEVKLSEKEEKARYKFMKEDPEYVAFRERRISSLNDKWEAMDKLKVKIATVDAKAFLKDNKGKAIFNLEYGDHDGLEGAIMEHGDIFRNVVHQKFSNH